MPAYRGRIPLDVFYTGTHHPQWLRQTDVPLFLSRRRLAGLKHLPRARGLWALDSGAFTELSMYGQWTVTIDQYIAEVRRYIDGIGHLQWAAAMDWVCEPWVRAKTGLSVEAHSQRTTENFLESLTRAPELPWAPVLQGWSGWEQSAGARARRGSAC